MSREPIRSILVAGDGIVGLSAALAFSRAFPAMTVTILRIEPDELALPATLPTIGRFHAALGFDELDLVRRGIAQHHLGTRMTGWGPNPWTHSFGEVGRPEGSVPFHQLWLRAAAEGGVAPFEQYCPAAIIGNAGKFVHPSGDPASPFASYLYGLRLHPDRYRTALREATKRLPILEGFGGVERGESGWISGVALAGDRRVHADLYVDCTGERALLANEPFENWSETIPPETFNLTPSRSPSPSGHPHPLDHVERNEEGWRYSATMPDGQLAGLAKTGGPPTGRRLPFSGNVLALGEAGVRLGALHSTGLSLAQNAILRAIELMPRSDFSPLELGEYNRQTAHEVERARDFVAFHYSPVSPPASLQRTLTQWRSRGRLPFFEGELFSASSWTQSLIGLGELPLGIAPLTHSIDADAARSAMTGFADGLVERAKQLPNYEDYLARMRA